MLFSFSVFSVSAGNDFDLDSWKNILNVDTSDLEIFEIPEDNSNDITSPVLPDTFLNNEITLMSLFPEDIQTKLVKYELTYKVGGKKLTGQLSTGRPYPFNWESLSTPAYSIINSSPVGILEIDVSQTSDYEGYIIVQGDTLDVKVEGVKFNIYMERYSSYEDETPTIYEFPPVDREKIYNNLTITGLDASSIERNLKDYISDMKTDVIDGLISFSFRLTNCPYNLKGISFNLYSEYVNIGWGIDNKYFADPLADLTFFRVRSGMVNGNISFTPVDTSGESVTNIENNTTNIVNNTQGIWDSIVNLPGMIGNAIMGLFVPQDPNFWFDVQSRMDNLLEENLGFVYQSFSILTDLFNEIISVDSDISVISVPYISYNFGDTVFEFGGWDVDLIPEGMEILQDVCRVITTIILLILLVNFGIKIFERIKSF